MAPGKFLYVRSLMNFFGIIRQAIRSQCSAGTAAAKSPIQIRVVVLFWCGFWCDWASWFKLGDSKLLEAEELEGRGDNEVVGCVSPGCQRQKIDGVVAIGRVIAETGCPRTAPEPTTRGRHHKLGAHQLDPRLRGRGRALGVTPVCPHHPSVFYWPGRKTEEFRSGVDAKFCCGAQNFEGVSRP